uniref:Chromosome 1 open reading frame 141 n=1 Tax=Caenorhabditis tropicalis TaxID=1561998 RepID=A0A1I7T5D0_9PELO
MALSESNNELPDDFLDNSYYERQMAEREAEEGENESPQKAPVFHFKVFGPPSPQSKESECEPGKVETSKSPKKKLSEVDKYDPYRDSSNQKKPMKQKIPEKITTIFGERMDYFLEDPWVLPVADVKRDTCPEESSPRTLITNPVFKSPLPLLNKDIQSSGIKKNQSIVKSKSRKNQDYCTLKLSETPRGQLAKKLETDAGYYIKMVQSAMQRENSSPFTSLKSERNEIEKPREYNNSKKTSQTDIKRNKNPPKKVPQERKVSNGGRSRKDFKNEERAKISESSHSDRLKKIGPRGDVPVIGHPDKTSQRYNHKKVIQKREENQSPPAINLEQKRNYGHISVIVSIRQLKI